MKIKIGKCPYCETPLIKGEAYVSGRRGTLHWESDDELTFEQESLFTKKRKTVTKHMHLRLLRNFSGDWLNDSREYITQVAWHCTRCKKVFAEFNTDIYN